MPILSARGGASANAYGWGSAKTLSGAYESIASASGNGSSGTITFSSIPGTFKHLQIRMLTRNGRGAAFGSTYITFNSVGGTSYSYHYIETSSTGSTTSVGSAASTSNIYIGDLPGSTALTSAMGVGIIDILDYASTTKNKTIKAITGFDNNGSGKVGVFSGALRSTSAITSIDITHSTTNGWTTDSRFDLYGIKESA